MSIYDRYMLLNRGEFFGFQGEHYYFQFQLSYCGERMVNVEYGHEKGETINVTKQDFLINLAMEVGEMWIVPEPKDAVRNFRVVVTPVNLNGNPQGNCYVTKPMTYREAYVYSESLTKTCNVGEIMDQERLTEFFDL